MPVRGAGPLRRGYRTGASRTASPAGPAEKADRAAVDIVFKAMHGGMHDVFPVADLARPLSRRQLSCRVGRLARGRMRVEGNLLVPDFQIARCALDVAESNVQVNEGLQRERCWSAFRP